jgi:hypothetical protein
MDHSRPDAREQSKQMPGFRTAVTATAPLACVRLPARGPKRVDRYAEPPMRPLPTWPIAAGALLLGFAVAEITGVRAAGGVVLFLGGLACGLRWRALLGLPRAIALVGVFLAGFALAHPLGHAIGSWPAVIAVAAVVGAISWRVADAPADAPAAAPAPHRG